MAEYWSADVPISMPLPPRAPKYLSMDGFVVTSGGLAHDIDEATYAEQSVPTFAPENHSLPVIRDDSDVDEPPPAKVVTF